MRKYLLIVREEIGISFANFDRKKYVALKKDLDTRLIEIGFSPSIKLENIGYVVNIQETVYKPYFENDFAVSAYCIIKAKDIARATEICKDLLTICPNTSFEIRPIIHN